MKNQFRLKKYLGEKIDWCRQNTTTLQGAAALTLGITLMILTRKVAIYLLLFITGFRLMLYGSRVLKISEVSHFMEQAREWVHGFIFSR